MFDASTDADDALIWIGRSELRGDGDVATIPRYAFELGILEAGERTFWAADPEIPAAFLSNREELFEDDDGVLLAGSSEVDDDGVTRVPSLLFQSGEAEPAGEGVPVFEPGTIVHFVTNPDLEAADVCMAVPERVARELFEDRLASAV